MSGSIPKPFMVSEQSQNASDSDARSNKTTPEIVAQDSSVVEQIGPSKWELVGDSLIEAWTRIGDILQQEVDVSKDPLADYSYLDVVFAEEFDQEGNLDEAEINNPKNIRHRARAAKKSFKYYLPFQQRADPDRNNASIDSMADVSLNEQFSDRKIRDLYIKQVADRVQSLSLASIMHIDKRIDDLVEDEKRGVMVGA